MTGQRCAKLAETILVADAAGDRPAIITKVFSATSVEACMFDPLPVYVKIATIHADRREALHLTQRDSGYHAYWKP